MVSRLRFELDSLRVATPCPVSWDSMTGDARKRFCGQCRLHVYDVSELTRGEAASLLRKGEGRVCMRMRRRADGRIVTKDCGRVRAALERRVAWMRAAAASVLAVLGFTGCGRDSQDPKPASDAGAPAERPEMGDVAVPPREPTMGLVAVPRSSEPGSEMGGVGAPPPASR